MNIGKDPSMVRAAYQMICPKCGKPALRRENTPSGVAYLHLTKHGSVRHFAEPKAEKKSIGTQPGTAGAARKGRASAASGFAACDETKPKGGRGRNVRR